MSTRGTVLLIEDDPMVRLTISAYLEDSGFKVYEAGNGLEGLDLFARLKPRIVITDLRMPEMDGFAFLGQVRQLNPATPVVVITGTADQNAADEALALGARVVLNKPITDMDQLEAVIQEALAGAGDAAGPGGPPSGGPRP